MRRTILWVAGLGVVAAVLASAGEPDRPAGSGPRVGEIYVSTGGGIGGGPRPDADTGPRASATRPAPAPAPTRPVPVVAKRFAWADGDTLLANAATFTVTRGLTPEQALTIVAPDALTPVLTVEQAQRFADLRNDTDGALDGTGPYYQVIAAASRRGWTVVLEDNNFVATDHRVLGRLTRHGRGTVLFTNVEADMSFLYARAGRVVRDFDPLLHSTVTGRRLPQEAGLPFGRRSGVEHTVALALELTRRLTGFAAQPRDVDLASYPMAVVVAL